MPDQMRKQEEFFPIPLPLVRLNPRSDWADDERDTSHGFADRCRDHGFPKSEAYWDRDFSMSRTSVLPHKPVHNQSDRWGQRDNDTGKGFSSEVLVVDPYRRDGRTPNREGSEGNRWQTSPLPKDGFNAQGDVNGRNGFGDKPMANSDTRKENKHIPPYFGDSTRNGVSTGNRDLAFGRRDIGHVTEARHRLNNTTESFGNRGSVQNTRDQYGTIQSSNSSIDAYHSRAVAKSSFSSNGKGYLMNDLKLNFDREKASFSKSERPYVEDPFVKDFGSTDFGEKDPFSGGLVGVIKRKKDVVKQADFHDPIRESFEAELERVQKLQELERQRIIEEQERALEQARREEEERRRLIREEEEQRRMLEEEAREAAWRAEQEQLESIRRAEEQKIAREEERRRTLMEEERRKQAANQKLLELEARIAKRQAEAAKCDGLVAAVADEKVSGVLKEKDVSKGVSLDNWENSDMMVERMTTSASSGSSIPNRTFETGPKPHPSREGSSSFLDGGKPVHSWKRDVFENGNSSSILVQDQDNGHYSPRQDASVCGRESGGRAFSRKEFYGGPGYMPSRTYFRGGIREPHMDEFAHLKEQRWNPPGDGDSFSKTREGDSEFYENLAEKYGNVGWGQGRSRSYPQSPYPELVYPNSEGDEIYLYARSRYSMRQPRVLPPPSLAPMHKSSFRGENERPGPSTFIDNDFHYNHTGRSESTLETGYYGGHQEKPEPSTFFDVQQHNVGLEEQKQDKDTTPRCDSQSSLSVSSPPNSPPHLSHDELDESDDSPVASATEEGKNFPPLSGNVNDVLNNKSESAKHSAMITSSSIFAGEDEEWRLENNEELQEQEYVEDDDGYQEEVVREEDDGDINLTQEFENMNLLREKDSSHMLDNLVLGFDEGVEVGIPGDDTERNPRNEESTFGTPEVSGTLGEKHGSVDGLHGDEQNLQPVDGSSRVGDDDSSRRILEIEEAMQESILQPISAPHTPIASDLLDGVDASSTSGLSSQQAVPSTITQSFMSTISSVPSQADLPKLQFGLFSGPSLIPSPVPAIQIGSIQMPLHLHPPVGPSLTRIHTSQPPLFQFGQLRYSSPISQGLLPMAPQSMSFFQSNVQGHYNLHQNSGTLPIRPSQGTTALSVMKNDVQSLPMNNQPVVVSKSQDLSHENVSRGLNSLSARENAECNALIPKSQTEISIAGDIKVMLGRGSQAEDKQHHDAAVKIYMPSSKEGGPESQLQSASASSVSLPRERDSSVSMVQGLLSGSKGRRFVHSLRNSSLRSSFPTSEACRSDSDRFQRRSQRIIQRKEFQIRENVDRRQSSGLNSSNNLVSDEKSNVNGRGMGTSTRSGSKRSIMPSKSLKLIGESESSFSGPVSSQEIDSESRAGKGNGKEALTNSKNILHSGEGNLKRNVSDEDVDAPLQSGIVRVFKQSGIEAPSDEDDFIEVRSKRQMLIDRREQREKEIKAKSVVTKPPRKPRATQSTVPSSRSNKISTSFGGEALINTRSDFVVSARRGLADKEISTGFTIVVSQPLAPIDAPAVNMDTQADTGSCTGKSLQTCSASVASSSGNDHGQGQLFDTKDKVMDTFQATLGSWGNERSNQQVMALTQTQLDEAMSPARFDTNVASLGGHSSSVSEPILPPSSISIRDKSFSSTASPINSLLAGEKIQFGAVTSPTVLPPSSRAVTHRIGSPGFSRSDIQISPNIATADSDCTLFFEKDKLPNESCVHLEDHEAEAEAAASAVAVAAISSDEIVGNGLGSVSVSNTKSFGGAGIDGITGGVASDRQLGNQLRDGESLSVSLPADLSVETPPMSLWPPLPSPQNSSSQILSHFPGGPPSHFPFYEMNHLLGGPIFAFGPHEESAGTQLQSQKSNASCPGPLGTWQQCHSTVDSFYGPTTGFTGPFISPPGGGIQGPPHMVVYNHFAPVGQFGQVGLSYMGTTYIPSGKQPDWEHNPASSAIGIGERSMNNMNTASPQRNPPNMSAPVQHLTPGSPLLPMAAPLAMFDMSPFQSASDISAQARWSHVPGSPLHSVPLSLPLQEPTDVVLPSQFSHGHPVDHSSATNRFSDSRTSTPSDKDQGFPVATDASVTQFRDELGLVDSSCSINAGASISAVNQSSCGSGIADAGQNGSGNNSKDQGPNASNTRPSQQKNLSAQHYRHSGYNHQRGGVVSQKNSSGGEWSHRRMGFHGRNLSLGSERGFPPSKTKQVYVAKQTISGTSTTG
ncbi:unnamed protein product [Ilex paraguariensis]|uniref:Uncharacterized protein n=1 Tax=Ilex paraguariensis TaxID=185542 RepID=A0ABC8TCW1_9AQUA